MKLAAALDFQNIPSPNFVLESRSGSVTSGVTGRTYLNSANGSVEVWNGTATIVLGSTTSTSATPNTVAMRNSSGAITAVTFIGNLQGNASSATLATSTTSFSGNAASFYLNRTNHSGTQLSATLSDLGPTVKAYTLDSFTAPVANVSFNSVKLTNLASPSSAADAANKGYVDSTINANNVSLMRTSIYDPTASGVVTAAVSANNLSLQPPSFYLNRANQTGTQLSVSISDLSPTVKAYTLDSFATPIANISLGGFQLNLVGSPSSGSDAATKAYVDAQVAQAQPSINNLTGTAWTPFTCTLTPSTGSITTQTSRSSFLQVGKVVFVSINVTVVAIGTASGAASLNMPVIPARLSVLTGIESVVTGLSISLVTSGSNGSLVTSTNANPAWNNGMLYAFNGVYEAA